MTQTGTRDERARLTVAKIGPAVLNGGFSTFLAFVFLANSDSHVFMTFFKIFFAVVLYGLLHGLVFLPVLLSLIGPASYPKEKDDEEPADGEESCPFTPQRKSEEKNEEQDHSTNLLDNDTDLKNDPKSEDRAAVLHVSSI
ncbi:hypothetical protein C7M84_004656 [Penaeus vannamei]|uniref:Uncharacterized protein n=1 Tax=Penaeus vannamei TaxID=6689 RepID=A0A423TJV0_PENVA|nr:hypothetical protein C7M84_004656 [Penaeus vannamei]